jgi:hypothetical protein
MGILTGAGGAVLVNELTDGSLDGKGLVIGFSIGQGFWAGAIAHMQQGADTSPHVGRGLCAASTRSYYARAPQYTRDRVEYAPWSERGYHPYLENDHHTERASDTGGSDCRRQSAEIF